MTAMAIDIAFARVCIRCGRKEDARQLLRSIVEAVEKEIQVEQQYRELAEGLSLEVS
jgi:predicted RNA-binding protein YlxR (DUF448 family)